jgi:sugar phosphate permease
MLWVLIAAYFCVQWANYFFVAWMPNYLQEGKHFSEQEMKMTTSWLFVFATVSAFLSGFFSDWLIRKKGVKLARRLIGVVSFSLMAVMVLISARSSNHLVVALCLMGAHFFQSPNVINSFASCVEMGGDRAGTVAGIMNFFGQAGAFLMSIFFGRIVDFTGSFDAPQFLMVGVLLAGALLWIRLDVTKGIAPQQALTPPALAFTSIGTAPIL